ncbi:MAG: OB-fold nucleic acid binding domain-containing protein, partial [Phenylobacterium sp.]|nr:OB-fold nucleic acid binding domain-containing protein [Phenylobacterium sp.]
LTGEGRVEDTAPLFARQGGLGATETQAALPLMSLPHQVAEDYRTTRLSLKAHPCGFFRRGLADRGAVPAAQLASLRHGAKVCVAGLVLVRQRPGTAKGVTFVTLEDETGGANLVIWKDAFEANRRLVMTSAFLLVHGRLQKAGEVIHVVAERFEDLTPQLSRLREDKAEIRAASNVTGRLIRSRDFH